MKRYIPLVLLLTACNGNPGNQISKPTPASVTPSGTASGNPDQSSATSAGGIFANAVRKQTLSLDLFGGATKSTVQASGNATNSSSGGTQTRGSAEGSPGVGAPQPAAAPMAPSVMPMPISARADGKMIAPGAWGGEFSNYVLQFAEESDFAASKATSLLNAYNQTVKPLLAQWDANARLIESQANIGTGTSQDQGYYYLPDSKGQPQQLKVNFLFRFASTSRKESLVVYLTDSDTRVHRLVWGESNLDLSKIKLDSGQAQATALKALSAKTNSGSYPSYPDQASPEIVILYDIPSSAHWSVSLNQSNGGSRYYASVNFPYQTGTGRDGEQQVYGSAEIDAVSGEILSLNRPVYYRQDKIGYPGAPPIAVDPPQPQKALVDPVPEQKPQT